MSDSGMSHTSAKDLSFQHQPVLLQAVLGFVPENALMVVDCTLGGGGHARSILEARPKAELLGADRDADAIQAATANLAPFAGRIMLRQTPFSGISRHVMAESVDFILADLGVSSPQLDRPERGFSFMAEGPLDMRMDPQGKGETAADVVNHASADKLIDILRRLGEERFAPRIVRAMVDARAEKPFTTTTELARLVAQAVPGRFHQRGKHPATRVFQALRIYVNRELDELEALLDKALGMLKPGGRVAIITFHSLEDRPVKDRFKSWESPCKCPPSMPLCTCDKLPLGKRLTRKPVVASGEETAANPRARSAKLRVFQKNLLPENPGKAAAK